MTSMLPAPRDLPPRSHARIRAELRRATSRRRPRLAPMVAGLASLAVIGVVATLLLVPSNHATPAPPAETGPTPPAVAGSAPPAVAGSAPPAVAGSAPPAVAGTPAPGTEPTSSVPPPPMPGVPADERRVMETQCGVSFRDPDLVLYHLIKDAAGTKALLYSGRSTVTCTIGGDPATPYNPGGGSVESFHWIPGDLAVDQISGSAGGSKQGKPGYWLTAGRISGKVARVTFTDGDETVDAVLANGTFLGRILQPAGWSPRNSEKVVVRAYDVDGQLVGESGHPGKPCYVTPLGTVLNRAREGNVNCLPATRWR